MTERDDDIGFEFFEEEPATREEQGTQFLPRITRRPPGGPPKGPRAPSGLTPLLRLVGLIALAILIIVLFVFWIQSCQGANKHNTYSSYMDKVSNVATASNAIGGEFDRLLTAPGETTTQLERQLNGLAQHQQQVVTNAQGIQPPGQLRDEQAAVIQALQLRLSGLRGFGLAFRKTSATKANADQAAQVLSTQGQRFVASDVVWSDLFKAPSLGVLQREGVTGVRVPSSTFLTASRGGPDLVSQSTLKPLWERLQGAASNGAKCNPGDLHGTGIVKTVVLPANTELSQDTEQTIKSTPGLAFQTSVQNTGNFQEVSVQVTLVIEKTPTPITETQTIPIIQSGATKTVTFKPLTKGQPPFGERTSVKVDVKPVPCERNRSNNTAEYPVIFSLGS
jgi:CARDB protein